MSLVYNLYQPGTGYISFKTPNFKEYESLKFDYFEDCILTDYNLVVI